MGLWNLFLLHKVKPIWLSKIIANLFGFVLLYPIALHNRETALLLSLFLAAYLYKNMQSISENLNQNNPKPQSVDSNNLPHHTKFQDFAIVQFMLSCFCACLFVFTTWEIYAIQALCGCVFLRIYDYYKPSLIGRFYNMDKNNILGNTIGAILCGILSGASVMILYYLYTKFLYYIQP